MNRLMSWLRGALVAAGMGLLKFARYDAAKADRFNGSLERRLGTDVNEPLRRDGPALRARSMQLYLNNSVARGAINAKVHHVLRSEIVPVPAAEAAGGDGAGDGAWKAWDAQAKVVWNRWADEPLFCDLSGRLPMRRQVRLMFKTGILLGECFVIRHTRANPDGVPDIRLEVVSPLMLAESAFGAGTGDRGRVTAQGTRPGIEYDEDLRPVRYWFRRRANSEEMVSYPAEDVIHLMKCDLPGQQYGEPLLASASETIFNIGQYLGSELKQAWHNSSIFGVLKTMGQNAMGGARVGEVGQGEKARSRRTITTDVGTILELKPNEDYEQVNQVRPGAGFEPFTKTMMRWIAVALSMPYSIVSGDGSDDNFSRSRMWLQLFETATNEDQELLRDDAVAKVYEWVIEAALLKGVLPLVTGADIRDYFHARYRMPGVPYIDPYKDIQADAEAMANYATTPSRVAAKRGEDFGETLDQMKEDLAAMKERGLPPPKWMERPKAAVTGDGGQGTEDGGQGTGDGGQGTGGGVIGDLIGEVAQ